MTRGGLYFLGATVACGQLQQTGAYPINCEYDHTIIFPTWRTSGEVAPVDGDQEMAPAEVAAGAASHLWNLLMQIKRWLQWTWLLAPILPTIKTQRQMAG